MALPKKYVVMDMESNGLLYEATKLHCIVLRVVDHKTEYCWRYYDGPKLGAQSHDGSLADGVHMLYDLVRDGHTLVGHNIFGFDLPLLNRMGYETEVLYMNPFSNKQGIDTYIAVSMRFPEEQPGLEYWGVKFRIHKPIIEDWSTLTKDMIFRCSEDTKINEVLLRHLDKQGGLDPMFDKARVLEQQVLWIHADQTLHGMRVDVIGAKRLLGKLDVRIAQLSDSLLKRLPAACVDHGPVNKAFLCTGAPTKMVTDWFKDGPAVYSKTIWPIEDGSFFDDPVSHVRLGGPFSRISFAPLNLNSHPKVKETLLSLGWQPTQYNRKKMDDGTWKRMSPKLTEDSYDSLPPGVGRELAEYLRLVHRRRFVLNETDPGKGLLSHVRDDGRVACDAFTCGTNTGRYRHSGAFVNLPKVTTVYGPEIRSLFVVPVERWLIGADLDGIEARMMGHYAFAYDGGAYATKVMSKAGVHDDNAKALGVSRDTAKTFLYAISYGAGNVKLAGILGCSIAQAKRKITAFWKANLGLRKLIDALELEYTRKGYITGLDGRPLYIRQRHKLMNTLVQNAATVIFKQWMVDSWLWSQGSHPNPRQVLAYHDELGWEIECLKKKAWFVGHNLANLAEDSGRKWSVKVPISATAKVGKRYSEVH